MEEARCSVYWLLLIMICPVATKTEDCPDHTGYYVYLHEYPYFNQYNLYLKFEEALVKDHSALEDLRARFVSTETVPVVFIMNLEVVNVTNIACGAYEYTPALCLSSDLKWHLCSPRPLSFRFTSQTASKLQSEQRIKEVDKSIKLLSLIHGNMPSIYLPYYNVFTSVFDYEGEFTLSLKINNLTCNPSYQLTKCALSELLSWVSQ